MGRRGTAERINRPKCSRACLPEHGLVLALGAVVAVEAAADARGVVAQPAARAVAPGLISIALEHVRAGGALIQGAVGSAAPQIAHAAYLLLGVPGGGVGAASLHGELLLREAHTGVAASIGADGSLAGDAVVVGEARALTSVSIAVTLVGALHHGVGVVGVLHLTDPGSILGAGSARAIGISPSRLSVDSVVACALVVGTAGSVAIAGIGTVSRHRDDDESEANKSELHDFQRNFTNDC
mmetsp:Transcript_20671/g.41975  ORF Transcript_20671/g.41975 Transcript_20671/m.41975 type:complete len:240 (+) Transcript_20671:164-883(+)